MAQAIFFLEDNTDVCINVLLLFKSICNVKLQTDYFIGRKCSLEVCAGLHVIFLGFGKAGIDQQCEFAEQILLFRHTHTHHQIFCKAGIKKPQTLPVFIFPMYSQWVKFCPEILNKSSPTGRNINSHITGQNLMHSTRRLFAEISFHNSICVFPQFLVKFSCNE